MEKKQEEVELLRVSPEDWAKYPIVRIKVPGVPMPQEHPEFLYRTEDHSVLGAVMEDGVDHDYAFIVLAKMPDGEYRGAALPTEYRCLPEMALSDMKPVMIDVWKKGAMSPMIAKQISDENWNKQMEEISETAGIPAQEVENRLFDGIADLRRKGMK
jgi:hypothetical protein